MVLLSETLYHDEKLFSSPAYRLVEFEEPVSLFGLVKLENHLTQLLGIKVDVVPKKDVRVELRERILKEVVYYEL
ncbi:MAG: nucleotidyltransferase family protein [bacterium]